MLIVFVNGNFNFNDSEKNQHLADFFYSIFRGLVIFFQYIKPKFNAWVSKISLPCKVLNLQKKTNSYWTCTCICTHHEKLPDIWERLLRFIYNSTYNYTVQVIGGLRYLKVVPSFWVLRWLLLFGGLFQDCLEIEMFSVVCFLLHHQEL